VEARKAVDFISRHSSWLALKLRDGWTMADCWREAHKLGTLHSGVSYQTFQRWCRRFADVIQQPPRRGAVTKIAVRRVEQAGAREGGVIDVASVAEPATKPPVAPTPVPALTDGSDDTRKARRAALLGGKSAEQIQQEELAQALRRSAPNSSTS